MNHPEPLRTDREAGRTRTATVGIFGHYGNENLGDEAIIEACIHNIRKRRPDARIVCFSLRPTDTSRRYDLPTHPVRYSDSRYVSRREEVEKEKRAPEAPGEGTETEAPKSLARRLKSALRAVPVVYPVARFLVSLPSNLRHWRKEIGFIRRSRSALKDIDLLVFAGSNQFLDNFGGPWGYPYAALKWTLLARSTGTRVAFVSVGAGPIFARTSMWMIRAALALADYKSVRDEPSRALIQAGRHGEPPLVYPDLAFSLPNAEDPPTVRADATVRKPTVGINLMAIYHSRYWYVGDQEKYDRYVRQLAEFSAYLIREGYPTFFFGNQPYDELVIVDLIEALVDLGLDRRDLRGRFKQSRTVKEYLEVVRQADVVLATRFHATVLALHTHRAVLGACYYVKARHLLEEMGQGEYALDLESLRHQDLQAGFRRLAGSLEAEVGKIAKKHAEYQRALDEQYDNVLKLLR